MRFKAKIDVMPQKEILDPQGKAVESALNQLSNGVVENVRIGKKIELTIEATDETEARKQIETLSSKLLANLIMEEFTIEIIGEKID